MNEGGTTRLHLMIAWRHLRAGERPGWVTPLLILSLYIIAVGLGYSIHSHTLQPDSLEELMSVGLLGEDMGEVSPRQGYYGAIGAGTLFIGVLLLLGAILSRFFTLLATVISFSVMLGCMALVIVLSLMTGLEYELRDKILGQRAHILVQREDARPFADYLEIVDDIADEPGVLGASPYLEGEIMVRSGVNRQGGILTGIIPSYHETVSNLRDIVVEGKYEYLDAPELIPKPEFEFDVFSDGPAPPVKQLKSAKDPDKPARPITDIDPFMDVPVRDEPDDDDWDDEGWEDPSVEIPKLRAAGVLPPAPGFKEGDSGAGDEPPTRASESDGKRKRGPAKKPASEATGDGDDRAAASATADRMLGFTSDEDEGWEDPAVEIPKLREQGVLPAKAETETETETDGAEGETDEDETGDAEEAPETEAQLAGEGDDFSVHGKGDGVIIGGEKAKELMVQVGDGVQLITPIGRLTPAGRMPGMMSARVAGVFDADHYEYDRWLVYAPLRVAQAFLRAGDRVTGIEIKVEDVHGVAETKALVEQAVARHGRDDLIVKDWQEINRSLFSAMALEKIAVFIALLCVILVASFGILGSNLMSVLEKAKEIAILKTMGYEDPKIERVFMVEGFVLGVLGSVAGILTGIAVCLGLKRFGLPYISGVPRFEQLPVAINPVEVVLVAVSALVIVWLSSLYPARVAARMRPVDAMRQAEE
ncbi:MAG: FtsX-like permease family protein [Nannocystaceae bacterium]|nr:FtsX-like permease family protein [Myxococcales bacterium]